MIEIERLKKYSEQDLDDLTRLMKILSPKFNGVVSAELMDDIIASAWHVQLVARDDGRIVGAATLTHMLGGCIGRSVAYLEDFVVDNNVQGKGVGSKLWDEMLAWCRERGVKSLEFTSNPKRVGARNFYEKRGAEIYDTDVFKMKIQ
jgi:GNAT superfamily N-acetyltransferase